MMVQQRAFRKGQKSGVAVAILSSFAGQHQSSFFFLAAFTVAHYRATFTRLTPSRESRRLQQQYQASDLTWPRKSTKVTGAAKLANATLLFNKVGLDYNLAGH